MTMECENCGFEQPGRKCLECQEEMPLWAKFCPHCGEAVKTDQQPVSGGDPFAIENRRLCPDGNCIGILGSDGRCVVCGKS